MPTPEEKYYEGMNILLAPVRRANSLIQTGILILILFAIGLGLPFYCLFTGTHMEAWMWEFTTSIVLTPFAIYFGRWFYAILFIPLTFVLAAAIYNFGDGLPFVPNYLCYGRTQAPFGLDITMPYTLDVGTCFALAYLLTCLISIAWGTPRFVKSVYKKRKLREEEKLREAEQERRQVEEQKRKAEAGRVEHSRKDAAAKKRKAERQSLLREHAALIDSFRRTLVSSGSKVAEMMRACKTMSEDADYESVEPRTLLRREMLSIVGAFATANGTAPSGLISFYIFLIEQTNYNRLTEQISDETAHLEIQHSAKNPTVVVPPTVSFLAMYDKFQNTTFASEAAATYTALIRAVAVTCRSSPVAVKMVESQYVELLRPYITSGTADSCKSGHAQDESSNSGCGECERHYEALGLKNGSTESEVKEAHRVLVQALHPDGWGDKSDVARRVAEEQTKSINAARDHLYSCRFARNT